MDFDIELERKKIKNMYLKILPPDGRIHISAPVRMSNEVIYSFIMQRQDWIRDKQQKLQSSCISKPQADISYTDGDFIYYNGIKYSLSVKVGAKAGISIKQSELVMCVPKNSTTEYRKKLLNKWYKENLSDIISSLLLQWETVIGVKADGFTIRSMKSRWGSCNIRTKRLCFSLQLAQKTQRCIEYVVVHELVHLLEGSHNHVFKAYMNRFLPDWRNIKKELNGPAS
jgi:hypothetical protein